MLEDVVAQTYREKGLESAVAEYRQLRARYYGGYAFDFSVRTLNTLGESLAKGGDHDAALGFVDLNLEFFPESTPALVLKARILAAAGEKDAARGVLLKAVELEPENQWIRGLLRELDKR